MTPCILTVLVDDLARRRGVAGEHGLALLVESGSERLLLDTGQTGLFLRNAKGLETPLDGVPVVLSHGHYDHTGGLAALLETSGPRDVLGHPGVFLPRRSVREPAREASMGSPLSADEVVAHSWQVETRCPAD